jgi:hypothetical protein
MLDLMFFWQSFWATYWQDQLRYYAENETRALKLRVNALEKEQHKLKTQYYRTIGN